MISLPRIQAITAPIAAPVPSAIAIAAEAYKYFSFSIHPAFAWLAAVAAFAGIETVGGASCYALVKLHRQRNYGVEFFVALTGVGVYIGSGLWTLYGSSIIIFFFLAPFAYFAYSIISSMREEIVEKVSETEAQTQLINAETRRTNAEIRKAKAENGVATTKATNSTSKKTYICPYCDVDQDVPQRYSVHMRYCEKKPKED